MNTDFKSKVDAYFLNELIMRKIQLPESQQGPWTIDTISTLFYEIIFDANNASIFHMSHHQLGDLMNVLQQHFTDYTNTSFNSNPETVINTFIFFNLYNLTLYRLAVIDKSHAMDCFSQFHHDGGIPILQTFSEMKSEVLALNHIHGTMAMLAHDLHPEIEEFHLTMGVLSHNAATTQLMVEAFLHEELRSSPIPMLDTWKKDAKLAYATYFQYLEQDAVSELTNRIDGVLQHIAPTP